jgi:hypothetical protein
MQENTFTYDRLGCAVRQELISVADSLAKELAARYIVERLEITVSRNKDFCFWPTTHLQQALVRVEEVLQGLDADTL